MFKTRLPGSEKSESSSAKFAAPSPLPEPTAITKRGTNVKTNTCTETLPNIFQIALQATRYLSTLTCHAQTFT